MAFQLDYVIQVPGRLSPPPLATLNVSISVKEFSPKITKITTGKKQGKPARKTTANNLSSLILCEAQQLARNRIVGLRASGLGLWKVKKKYNSNIKQYAWPIQKPPCLPQDVTLLIKLTHQLFHPQLLILAPRTFLSMGGLWVWVLWWDLGNLHGWFGVQLKEIIEWRWRGGKADFPPPSRRCQGVGG